MQTVNGIRVDGSTLFNANQVSVRTQSPAEASRYESAMVGLLGQIERNLIGRILLRSLQDSIQGGRSLTIVPWTVRTNAQGGVEGFGLHGQQVSREEQLQRVEAGTTPGHQVLDSNGQQVSHASGAPAVGTGLGTNAVTLFDPQRFSRHLSSQTGGRADEVLFHELIHAHQAMIGRMDSVPTHDRFENQQEFDAVVITDVYIAAKGALMARNTHEFNRGRGVFTAFNPANVLVNSPFHVGTDANHPGRIASARVAQRSQANLFILFARDQHLANAVATQGANIPYNPLRDHLAMPMRRYT